jgi:uncharacterized protein with PIN domain
LEIEDAGELIFKTYYMVKWETVPQAESSQVCVKCAQRMKKVEPVHDKKGLVYEGLVCHNCKTVFWLKIS